MLAYNAAESPAFEVVTLPLVLVAGDTVLGHAPKTLEHAVSPVSRKELSFMFLRLVQGLLGSVPLVHVEDVCRAEIFAAEEASDGRYICNSLDTTIVEMARFLADKYPQYDVSTNL